METTSQILTAIRDMGADITENVANKVKVDLNEKFERLGNDVVSLQKDVSTNSDHIGEIKQSCREVQAAKRTRHSLIPSAAATPRRLDPATLIKWGAFGTAVLGPTIYTILHLL